MSPNRESGLTLIEILMAIGLVSILAVVGIGAFSDSLTEQKFNATTSKLEQIRIAVVGDPTMKEGGTRSSFGYLGDVGDFPTTAQGLAALTAAATGISAYSVSSANRIGVGWRGPYVTASGLSAVSWTDGWGGTLTYAYSAGSVTVTSLGANLAAGGTGFDQDLSLSIPLSSYRATVRGYISLKGGPISTAAEVKLFQPNGSGTLQTVTISVTAGSAGYFSQANVPFGKRSLILYIPNSTSPTTTIGPVVFTVDRTDYEIPANLLETQP